MHTLDELQRFEPFRVLSEDSRTLLAQGLVSKQCASADMALHKGQPVSGAYVVLAGRLRVFSLSPNGTEATLYFIDPGETCVLALNCLFNDLLYPAWVQAETASSFVRGDRQALNAAQLRGMDLFESTGCVVCHLGPNFSSASLFDTRAPYRVFPAFDSAELRRYRLGDDPGRAQVGNRRGLWRVPSLRNVALTAPYFHNGSVNKLEDAVRIMATAQLGRTIAIKPSAETAVRWSPVDRSLHRVVRRELTQADVDDIAAFLRALSRERLAAGLRGKIPRG